MNNFEPFPKLHRLSRDIVITEKLDGTNAQILITDDGRLLAGSRTRWVTPEDDNFGFASWVQDNKEALLRLGPGRHFGEWWGRGIQRGYGLAERKFSLFNTVRWQDKPIPSCCDLVPILFHGIFSEAAINNTLELLRTNGSVAAPGYKNPEGIVVYHMAANVGFKKTLFKDDAPKSTWTAIPKPSLSLPWVVE